MNKALYLVSVLIALVGVFGFLDPNGYMGYATLPITVALGILSALLIYLHGKNKSDK